MSIDVISTFKNLLKTGLVCMSLPVGEKCFHTGPLFCAFCDLMLFHGHVIMRFPCSGNYEVPVAKQELFLKRRKLCAIRGFVFAL